MRVRGWWVSRVLRNICNISLLADEPVPSDVLTETEALAQYPAVLAPAENSRAVLAEFGGEFGWGVPDEVDVSRHV